MKVAPKVPVKMHSVDAQALQTSQRNQLREVKLLRNYNKHCVGSVLACLGDTQVLCTVSYSNDVPRFMRGTGRGWLTAEYGMLPGSTNKRNDREAVRGKQSGRTLEIQRLIGRSLRGAVDLEAIGQRTLKVDCDVLQADGGTRTCAITGAAVALHDAIRVLAERGSVSASVFRQLVAAVSVGIVDGESVLDLDYQLDSNAETDMNVVMTEDGNFIEVQGTGEKDSFSRTQLDALLDLAVRGNKELFNKQRQALELELPA